MKQYRKYLPHLIIAVLLAAFYFWRYKRAPEIALSDIQLFTSPGMAASASEVFSDKTILHFYASWCGPCMQELREINTHFEEYKAKGYEFHFITDDSWDKINAFRNKMPAEIQYYQTPSLKEVGIFSIPATYFLHDQKIVHKQIGVVAWSDFQQIENYFSEQ